MTSHPKDLSDDLIEAMRDCDKVCVTCICAAVWKQPDLKGDEPPLYQGAVLELVEKIGRQCRTLP